MRIERACIIFLPSSSAWKESARQAKVFFPLLLTAFSPIMFGLNKKSICFPFVFWMLCAFWMVWYVCAIEHCVVYTSSYNAILEGRTHHASPLFCHLIVSLPLAYLFLHIRWGILWCAKRLHKRARIIHTLHYSVFQYVCILGIYFVGLYSL